MPNIFVKIRNLYAEGGVEIVTPGVARTLIQPDADVIHFLDEHVVTSPNAPELLAPHFKKIEEFLDDLRRTNWMITWGLWGMTALLWASAGLDIFMKGELGAEAILGFGLGCLPPLVKPALIWLLRKEIQSRLGEFAIASERAT